MKERISRRDFLKKTGVYAFVLSLTRFQGLPGTSDAPKYDFPTTGETLGRVAAYSVILYDKPSDSAGYLKTISRDTVLPITQTVIGESYWSYNKLWYELDGQGFVHSWSVQPVYFNQNLVVEHVPPKGLLVEVTVPYTNGVLHPAWQDSIVYRLYYGTTYWISRVVVDGKGNPWYRILDEDGYLFYADATHLHVVSADELAPLSPGIAQESKHIEVNLREQNVVAFEDRKPVFMTRAATGAVFSTGNFSTPVGQFLTNRKRPSRHMRDPNGSSYDLPGVPWVCYVNSNGVAFHGTYWHNDFGAPRSHGCINLTNDAAKWLYRWTQPNVPVNELFLDDEFGTLVKIK